MPPEASEPLGAGADHCAAPVPHLHLRRLAWTAAACAAGYAVVTVLVVTGATTALDMWWNELLAAHRGRVGIWIAQALTVTGDVPLNTAFRVSVAVVLLWQRRRLWFWAWAVAAALSPLLVEVSKFAVGRARPEDFVWSAHGFAYPSGHVAAAATNAVLVVLVLLPLRHRRTGIICAALWVAAMAMARSLLGAHWLADCVGGMLLGLAVPCATVAAVFAPRARRRREEVGTWDAPSP